jgi:hypothetical protein
MNRTHAPDDIRIADRMKRSNDPKIPGSLVQDSEEQPDDKMEANMGTASDAREAK